MRWWPRRKAAVVVTDAERPLPGEEPPPPPEPRDFICKHCGPVEQQVPDEHLNTSDHRQKQYAYLRGNRTVESMAEQEIARERLS